MFNQPRLTDLNTASPPFYPSRLACVHLSDDGLAVSFHLYQEPTANIDLVGYSLGDDVMIPSCISLHKTTNQLMVGALERYSEPITFQRPHH